MLFVLERDPRAPEFIIYPKKKNQEKETMLGQHWFIGNN